MDSNTRPEVHYRELDTPSTPSSALYGESQAEETIDTSIGNYYEGIALVAIGIVILGIVVLILLKQHFNPTRTH